MKTNIHAQSGKLKAILLAAIVAASPAFAVTTSLIHHTGQAVPALAGLPPGTNWKTLGRPSLTAEGAWIGFGSSVLLPNGLSGFGIFDGPTSSPVCYVKAGDEALSKFAPLIINVPTVKFGKFRGEPVFGEPVLDPALNLYRGPWATVATVLMMNTAFDGIWAGVGAKNREVVRLNASVSGHPLPSGHNLLPGTTFKAFTNLQMTPNGTLFFTSDLLDGGNSAGAIKHSLWAYRFNLVEYNSRNGVLSAPASCVLCVGETITPDPINFPTITGEVTKIFAMGEGEIAGSTASHGRVDADNSIIPICYQVKVGNSLYAVAAEVRGTTSATLTTIGMSNAGMLIYPSSPDKAPFGHAYNSPDLPASGGLVSTVFTQGLNGPRVLDRNAPANKAQFLGRAPDSTGTLTSFQYFHFSSTVSGYASSNAVSLAFLSSTVSISNVNAKCIYSNANHSLTMREIAKRGGPIAFSPGVGVFQYYKEFTHLSHMDGKGPLFEGSITIPLGTSATTSYGLWGCDPNVFTGFGVGTGLGGDAQLLMKNGDMVSGRLIRSFQCLAPVFGSQGQRRAWAMNDNNPATRPVIMKVFIDQSSGGGTGIAKVSY